MNMWDYDKLFAEGNIVGLHNVREGETYGWTVVDKSYWHQSGQINWQDYFNPELSFDTGFCLFEIQYIIRLDDKGQVSERLFDRDKDMKPEANPMPELEHGMIIEIVSNDKKILGYIDKYRDLIVYQNGAYDTIESYRVWANKQVIAIYKDVESFNQCNYTEPIWRKSN